MKVSIAMITYNHEEFIAKALDSVLMQRTNFEYEIVIGEDCSTDNTRSIVIDYQKKYPEKIRLLLNEKNLGMHKNLGQTYQACRGKYLALLEGDDYWTSPSKLQKQVDFLDKNPECVICFHDVKIIYKDGSRSAHNYCKNNQKEFSTIDDLLEENFMPTCSIMFRTGLVSKIPDWIYSLALADWPISILIAQHGQIGYINEIMATYVVHREGVSFIMRQDPMQGNIAVIAMYEKLYSNIEPKYRYQITRALQKLYLNVLERYIEIGDLTNAKTFFKKCLSIPQLTSKPYLKLFVRLYAPLLYKNLKTIKLAIKLLRCSLEKGFASIYYMYKILWIKAPKGKINILCLVPFYVVGGAEKVLLSIANSVDSNKYSLHIISTTSADNVWIDKFKYYFKNVFSPSERILREDIFKLFLSKLIRRLRIDILFISNSMLGYACLPYLKQRYTNIKVVDIIHNDEAFEDLPGFASSTPHVDKRICISNRVKKYLLNKYDGNGYDDISKNKLTVIYNGINFAEFSYTREKNCAFRRSHNIPDKFKLISFVGRFADEKNPLLFVDIAKKTVESLRISYPIKFVMAGDGPEYEAVKAKISFNTMDEYFLLPGMIGNVSELLADTDLFLVTSKSEGIPLVMQEAMLMGVPVISTTVGAVGEVIEDGVNGYIVDPNSNVVEAFTQRIMLLLLDSAKMTLLGEKGRDTIIKSYSLEVMGAQYQKIFEDLMNS